MRAQQEGKVDGRAYSTVRFIASDFEEMKCLLLVSWINCHYLANGSKSQYPTRPCNARVVANMQNYLQPTMELSPVWLLVLQAYPGEFVISGSHGRSFKWCNYRRRHKQSIRLASGCSPRWWSTLAESMPNLSPCRSGYKLSHNAGILGKSLIHYCEWFYFQLRLLTFDWHLQNKFLFLTVTSTRSVRECV